MFLGNIRAAFEQHPELTNLLLDDFFAEAVQRCQVSLDAGMFMKLAETS